MSRLTGVTPFPPDFAARYRALGYWGDRSLGSVYDELFKTHGDRIAIVAGAETITYTELCERVRRLALNLLELGVGPLDRAVMQLPNIPEFVYVYFAFQLIGAVPIMALAQHRELELDAFVTLTEATVHVVPERLGEFDFAAFALAARQRNPSLRLTLLAGAKDEPPPGIESISDLLQRPPRLPESILDAARIDADEVCCLQLSGGTTGVPKLIPRTNNDYVYNAKVAAAVNDIRPDDALLVVLPIAHNFPLASPGISGFFLHGARAVLSTSSRPADVFPIIERERVTHVELVPALLIRWLADPQLSRHDLSSIRIINTGGQKLQEEVKRRAEATLPGCIVQEVFGMAEGMLFFPRVTDPRHVRLETVGRPVSAADEVRLVDDMGADVAEGDVGELLCRGPYTLRGYYAVPDHNATAFTADGFFKTGDLMRRHPSGNYVVEGRKKDLINRGGEKIGAEDVENLILSHPAVLNASCVPVSDPVLGERMCAFVVLRDGSSLTLGELTAFLGEHGLARYKHPERLETIAELPMSKFGKVAKHELTRLAESRESQERPAR
jgi:2,3-dihydroxybenzoate-AMP ligase